MTDPETPAREDVDIDVSAGEAAAAPEADDVVLTTDDEAARKDLPVRPGNS